MFWKNKTPVEKRGPINIPGWLGAYIVPELQKLPYTDHWVKYKGVVKRRNNTRAFDIRVFDEWETNQRKMKVTDYSFFDACPELVQFEGWYDEATKKADIKLNPKSCLQPDTKTA